jgi:hypothetical protein
LDQWYCDRGHSQMNVIRGSHRMRADRPKSIDVEVHRTCGFGVRDGHRGAFPRADLAGRTRCLNARQRPRLKAPPGRAPDGCIAESIGELTIISSGCLAAGDRGPSATIASALSNVPNMTKKRLESTRQARQGVSLFLMNYRQISVALRREQSQTEIFVHPSQLSLPRGVAGIG